MQNISKDEKVNKSLRYSWWDGTFSSSMQAIFDNYIAPFAIYLQATAPQLALLTSLPNLIGNLLQIKAPDMLEKRGSRLKIVTFFIFLQATMWLAVILVPFIALTDRVPLLIVFVIILTSFGLFGTSAWSSMMSDLVPAEVRGSYFSWRNKTLGLMGLGAGFLAGLVLYLFKARPITGFIIIFSAAMLFRYISWWCIARMYDPPLHIKEEDSFTFWEFIRRWRQSNFVKFVFFVAGINFGTYMAAPFFSLYMLRDLHMNYLAYTAVIITSPLVTLLMMNAWGKQADIVGNVKVLKLTSIFIPFIPITWLFGHSLWYLLCIQVFGGFFWAGFNLCTINFIYDAATPEKRTRCISYFNVINGFGIFAGAMTGGYLYKVVPSLFGYTFLMVCLFSGVTRAMVMVILGRRIREVRPVKHISAGELFYSVLLGAKE
ncbi:MAG: MFS transporter [bacterium]|nr:MFS transporter [bacterium]